jgi:hypothetical protein
MFTSSRSFPRARREGFATFHERCKVKIREIQTVGLEEKDWDGVWAQQGSGMRGGGFFFLFLFLQFYTCSRS